MAEPVRIEQQFFNTWDRARSTSSDDYVFLITWPDGSTSERATIPNDWIAIERETYRAQQAERMAKLDASIEANRQPLGRVA